MEDQITIKIEEGKKEELEAAAKKRGLNLSGYIRMILYRELENESGA